MPKLNENYQNLKESYLFVEIAHRVAKYAEANPDKKIIRLGIGDVTLPLEPLAVSSKAICLARARAILASSLSSERTPDSRV